MESVPEQLEALNKASQAFGEVRSWFAEHDYELAHDGKQWRLATPEERTKDRLLTSEQLTESLKDWKPQIMPHQHTYQVQVSDTAIVRCCTGCGVTHMLWSYRDGAWTERWTKIEDER